VGRAKALMRLGQRGYSYGVDPFARSDASTTFVGGMHNIGPSTMFLLHHLASNVLSVKKDGDRNLTTHQGEGAYFGSMEFDALLACGASVIGNSLLNKQSDSQNILVCKVCNGTLFKVEDKTKNEGWPKCIGESREGGMCSGHGRGDLAFFQNSRTTVQVVQILGASGIDIKFPHVHTQTRVKPAGAISAGAGAGAV